MNIFILKLVSNQLTVPVRIDGRQEQEENIGAIEPGSMYTHVGHARAGSTSTVSCEAGWRGAL